MFEDKTFETILSDMLEYFSNRNPDLDTREGSIIYNALAPIAMELETVYHEMDMILDETFLETASKEYLVKHGDQIGVELNDATFARFKGEFDVDVEIGSRFNLDEFNYTVIAKLSHPTGTNQYYTFELECETDGSEPNSILGNLTPITYVANLTHAELVAVITPGEDEEETEQYRYRLQTHVKNPPVNGNVYQYEEWLNNYDGVGKYQVTPCWNGVNTVKLTVLNAEDRAASPEFISEVQEYFDPIESRGMGDGQAPIGAIVTVDTATEVLTVFNCEVVLKDGYSEPVGVKDAIKKYLKELPLDGATVDYMSVWSEIYKVESVESINGLSIIIEGVVMDISVQPFTTNHTLTSGKIAVFDDTESLIVGVQ
jgi:uncharacterized phage protein gp47/JayE